MDKLEKPRSIITLEEVAALLHTPKSFHENRKKGVGASDTDKLAKGEWADIWEVKTGRREPDDLSGNLNILMGLWTEPLNLWRVQEKTGYTIHSRQKEFKASEFDKIRCAVDGLATTPEGEEYLVEAKHYNQFLDEGKALEIRWWQIQHQFLCTGLKKGILSVFFGNGVHEMYEVEPNPGDQQKVIEFCREFWGHVERDEAPPDHESLKVNVGTAGRRVDMGENNMWMDKADILVRTKAARDDHEKAKKAIKELMPADASWAFGGGVSISRGKVRKDGKEGSLTTKIKENDDE